MEDAVEIAASEEGLEDLAIVIAKLNDCLSRRADSAENLFGFLLCVPSRLPGVVERLAMTQPPPVAVKAGRLLLELGRLYSQPGVSIGWNA